MSSIAPDLPRSRTVGRSAFSDAIRKEQAMLLHATPGRFAGHLINAALVGVVLWGSVPDFVILAWLVTLSVIAVGRYLMARAYRRAAPSAARAGTWIRRFMIGSTLAAIAWGSGVLMVWQSPDLVHHVFIAFIIAGTCAVAAALSYAHLPTVYLFLAFASTPLAVNFFVSGSQVYLAMGIMTVLMMLLLAVQARAANSLLVQSVVLREENRLLVDQLSDARDNLEKRVAERTAELDRVNSSLRREMGAHKETEARLRQAHKMEAVGQLTGGIAHDFNNLLAVVQGNGEILRDHLAKTPLVAEADAILRASNRGAKLTQRLLAFSRRQTLWPEVLDLNELISSMLVILGRTLGGGIDIRFRPEPGLPAVRLDRSQMENAILNLAINARDALTNGGQLTISTSCARLERPTASTEGSDETPLRGDCVLLSVEDTGAGIPGHHLEKVWDPFFTTKDIGAGTGLGLSMVYGFVRQSGGHAEIDSILGRGTVIRLYLPLANSVAGCAPEMTDETPAKATAAKDGLPGREADSFRAGGSETFLLVDDDNDIRRMVGGYLGRLGYHVAAAANAEEAMNYVRREGLPALILSDVVLGAGLSGPEMVDRLKREAGPVRVLFISGHAADCPVSFSGCSDAAGPVVIDKPFALGELANHVRLALDDCTESSPKEV